MVFIAPVTAQLSCLRTTTMNRDVISSSSRQPRSRPRSLPPGSMSELPPSSSSPFRLIRFAWFPHLHSISITHSQGWAISSRFIILSITMNQPIGASSFHSLDRYRQNLAIASASIVAMCRAESSKPAQFLIRGRFFSVFGVKIFRGVSILISVSIFVTI